ncbi:PucR family transcriptional regulator [Nocardia arthritidis]|uniref:PucR family transcriptional regulator n=1 Tax=Nocardia arthritidis TaxID=228602 RepID=A0A6G9YEI7_9NOCA|nr:PucR family transcriptional regulator [Nocardia arthritidis]QIS11413.1 PucR family transcriptional regulator [Nocardia arthritidis]
MTVSVEWVLRQPDLAVRLRGGAAGVRHDIQLVVTTELENPFRWLSGGELVLTTGMRLPNGVERRTAYLRGLAECGVAGLGFGTGLTHAEVPADLIAAADAIGLPVFEVPLPIPFAAIVKRVTARIAEQQYDAVLRASNAQPRMTRALIRSGADAIVAELAKSLSATVIVLDPDGAVVEYQPGRTDPGLVRTAREAAASGPASGVRTDPSGASITHQRIGVGRRRHGDLVVVSAAPLGHVDQILLGHANSLLALDFAKPARLQATQHLLNAQALALLLGADTDPEPAWAQLTQAADPQGLIRVLAAECDTEEAADAMRDAAEDAVIRAGLPLFLHRTGHLVLVVLPAARAVPVAHRVNAQIIGGTRRFIRAGLGAAHPVRELATAVSGARTAAAAAERGGPVVESGSLTLLSHAATRDVLASMAVTVLRPVLDYDRAHGTELVVALRTFLEANGHWDAAAAASGVHRHTLRKRIGTVRDLLDRDLDSARVRAELLLALLAHGD